MKLKEDERAAIPSEAVRIDGGRRTMALYVHIPFCLRKCHYCNFNSTELNGGGLVDEYLSAIEKDIDKISRKSTLFRSVYIGGGTPTVLNERQLRRLLTSIDRCIDGKRLVEYTIEANPGTLDSRKVAALRESMVNRVSLGVQSFNDRHLARLGRIHTGEQVVRTYSLLREAGVENVGMDLIFGIPGQDMDEWQDDLDRVVSLDPGHISTYSLTYEAGTSFYDWVSGGTLRRVEEAVELGMYEAAVSILTEAGFRHYEISNFAKAGKRSIHNMVYWQNQEYIGIGTGACSFVAGTRTSNEVDITKYIQNVKAGRGNTVFSEHLPRREHAVETIIMGLRMTSGISDDRFLRQTGFTLKEIFNDHIPSLLDAGYINMDNDRLRLTRKGLHVADSIMMEFMD